MCIYLLVLVFFKGNTTYPSEKKNIMHSFVKQRKSVCVLCPVSTALVGFISRPNYCDTTQLHPDSDPSNPSLHSQFVELNEAYRVLSKDLSRKDYDLKIRHPYSGNQAFRSASSYTNYRERWRYTMCQFVFCWVYSVVSTWCTSLETLLSGLCLLYVPQTCFINVSV